MKRLLFILTLSLSVTAFSQSYPVRNVNDDYFVSSFFNSTVSKDIPYEFTRDKDGMYWFLYRSVNNNEVFSFDGVNWKSYRLRFPDGRSNPIHLNHIFTAGDDNVWLTTEYGFFVFDRQADCFLSIKEKYPDIIDLPPSATTCINGAPGTLIFLSFGRDGFYILDLHSKKVKQVIIDSTNKTTVADRVTQIAADKAGNIWGTTLERRGVWQYNQFSGKMRCSWKGELPQFADKRFLTFINFTYSEKENVLWISHVDNSYLEKMDLTTGSSVFYTFFDALKVRADTTVSNRHKVFTVRIDMDSNAWINAGMGKYLVKYNKEISQMEYLTNERDVFPVGDMEFFRTEIPVQNDPNNILFWVFGTDKFSMIRKRGEVAKHYYFDTLSESGITPRDFLNTDNADRSRQKIFFEKGKNDLYFLLQQGEGRPKLICFDKNFHIKKVLLNEQWKQYPAFFRPEFDPDTSYIAILRPGIEPLDFRNIVLKDFRVDLTTLKMEEVRLSFKQRVWRYGSADNHNVYWLFSNGFLYSYDPSMDNLDSIYISKPTEKKTHVINMVKGYSYPNTLHKNSSTFWISFYPVRELYKVNLVTKRVEKIFKTCLDQPDCSIPGSIYGLYGFDSVYVYLRSSLHGMLIHTKTDSITDLSRLVKKRLPIERPAGVTLFRDWVIIVYPSHIYLLNRVSGTQRELLLDDDFKWRVAPLFSKPLVSDDGELTLMSMANKGFIVFNVDSPIHRAKPGFVNYSFIKIDNKELLLDSIISNGGITLKYNKYNNIQISFSDLSVFAAGKKSYEYAFYRGGDTVWNKINGKPELTLSDLSPGKYRLLIRASNIYGDYSEKASSLNIEILPLFRQTWWFRGMILAGIGLFFYGLYRYRMQQLNRLQIVRNNIASDLHDDIGSTLNSISVYSEVAKQQAGKDIPALDLIGANSRKIIESMSDIVWTINPENDSFEKIIVRMRSFAYQMMKAKNIEFTFEADEKLNSITLPMQVRKNFYLVFKEAINNLVKYSGATRVFISLRQENKAIIMNIRDNGIGILVNSETMGNGMLNMKRRAEEIQAILQIESEREQGTGVEMVLKI